MRLSVPLPRGPRTSQSSRRTSECRSSKKNFQSTPPAYLQPAVPRRLQRHELEVHKSSFFPRTVIQETTLSQQSERLPRTAPTCGVRVRSLLIPPPSIIKWHLDKSSSHREPTPTRTLNSLSPPKHQGSQDLQKQARWRHQDDTKAPPNAHPTIRLGTMTVSSAFLERPRTHREHTHSSASSTAEHGNRTSGPRHTTPTGNRRQQANHD